MQVLIEYTSPSKEVKMQWSNQNRYWTALLAMIFALTTLSAEAQPGKHWLKKKKGKRTEKKAQKIRADNYVPGTEWEAYFKDDDGRTRKLLQPAEANPDQDWLGLTFTDYAGPRLRLAVMKVENKTSYAEQVAEGGSRAERVLSLFLRPHDVSTVPIGAIEELVMTSFFNTGRFELIERKRLDENLQEQDFGASERVTKQTAVKVGQGLGADYQVFAAVNEWTPKKSSAGGAGVIGGVIGGGKSKAEVAMSFRVVDAATSQVLFATTERATAGSWSIGIGGFAGIPGIGGAKKKSPINYAVMACINKGAYKLATWLKDRAWRGSVMRVDGSKIYINAGSNRGIEMGIHMTCLAQGEELVDPETGINLGASTEAIGSLMVTSVQEKYSIGTVVQGCDGLKKGDRVETQSSAGPKSETAP